MNREQSGDADAMEDIRAAMAGGTGGRGRVRVQCQTLRGVMRCPEKAGGALERGRGIGDWRGDAGGREREGEGGDLAGNHFLLEALYGFDPPHSPSQPSWIVVHPTHASRCQMPPKKLMSQRMFLIFYPLFLPPSPPDLPITRRPYFSSLGPVSRLQPRVVAILASPPSSSRTTFIHFPTSPPLAISALPSLLPVSIAIS